MGDRGPRCQIPGRCHVSLMERVLPSKNREGCLCRSQPGGMHVVGRHPPSKKPDHSPEFRATGQFSRHASISNADLEPRIGSVKDHEGHGAFLDGAWTNWVSRSGDWHAWQSATYSGLGSGRVRPAFHARLRLGKPPAVADGRQQLATVIG